MSTKHYQTQTTTATLSSSPSSSSSAANSTNEPISTTNSLEQTLIEAINNGTIRDKQILLAAENEMGKFIGSNLQRQPLSSSLSNSLNSYQRMLVHRLGDSFGIKRTLEAGQMYLERTPTSAWPSLRLETLIARQNPTTPSNSDLGLNQPNLSSISTTPTTHPTLSSPTNTESLSPPNPASQAILAPPKTFKIMSRALSQPSRQSNRNLMPSTASSGSSTDCSLSESKRNEMSYERRQAAYLEARNRIFAANSSSTENSTAESNAGSTSSSSGPGGPTPDDDRLSPTTTTFKNSRSPSDSLVSPVSQDQSTPESTASEAAHHQPQKSKSKTTDSNTKPTAVKLRPSATSFDPSAKAHGYEEVTIIEVDDQSITLPYQHDPNVYLHNGSYPIYPNGFLQRDPRLGPNGPAHHFKPFPPPASGPYPVSHQIPNNSISAPPPFLHPSSSSSSSSSYQPPESSTNMPTMIGTVPLAPIAHQQQHPHHHPHPHPHPHNGSHPASDNGRTLFFPENVRPTAPELGYNFGPPATDQHSVPFVPHPPHSNGFPPNDFNNRHPFFPRPPPPLDHNTGFSWPNPNPSLPPPHQAHHLHNQHNQHHHQFHEPLDIQHLNKSANNHLLRHANNHNRFPKPSADSRPSSSSSHQDPPSSSLILPDPSSSSSATTNTNSLVSSFTHLNLTTTNNLRASSSPSTSLTNGGLLKHPLGSSRFVRANGVHHHLPLASKHHHHLHHHHHHHPLPVKPKWNNFNNNNSPSSNSHPSQPCNPYDHDRLASSSSSSNTTTTTNISVPIPAGNLSVDSSKLINHNLCLNDLPTPSSSSSTTTTS